MNRSNSATPPPAPIFTFKCVDCGSKSQTTTPPEDNMLECKKCGFATVQTLYAVKR